MKMGRRILSIFLVALMLATVAPIGGIAGSAERASAGLQAAKAPGSTVVIGSGVCGAQGDNLSWKLTDDGTLTISGTGAMKDYTWEDPAPWSDAKRNDLLLKIGYASVDDFYDAAMSGMVSIEDCVKVFVGDDSFQKYHVVIEEGVTTVGAYAFYSMDATIGSVSLPSTMRSIGESAFQRADFLHIDLPEGLEKIGDGAFSSVPLEEIIIPSSCTEIGSGAFSSPLASKIVVLNDTVDISGISLPSKWFDYSFPTFRDYKTFYRIYELFEYIGKAGYCLEHMDDTAFLQAYARRFSEVGLSEEGIAGAMQLMLRAEATRCCVENHISGETLEDGLASAFAELNQILGTDYSDWSEIALVNYCSLSTRNDISKSQLESFIPAQMAIRFTNDFMQTIADHTGLSIEWLKRVISQNTDTKEAAYSNTYFTSIDNETSSYSFFEDVVVYASCASKACEMAFENGVTFSHYQPDSDALTYTVTREPDGCEETSEVTYRCSVCNHTVTKNDYRMHDWVPGTVLKEPTCTESGSVQCTCAACGETSVRSLSSLGHDKQIKSVLKEATCSEPGQAVYACSRCRLETTETTDALGHAWRFGLECMHPLFPESPHVICSRCGKQGYSLVDDFGDYALPGEDNARTYFDAPISAAFAIKEPMNRDLKVQIMHQHRDLEDNGTFPEKVLLLDVDTDETTELYAFDRTMYKRLIEVTVPAALLQNGHTYALQFSYFYHEGGFEKATYISDVTLVDDIRPHVLDGGKTTKEATCTEMGEKTFYCTACGFAQKTEEINPRGHAWGTWTKLNESEHQRVCANDPVHKEIAAHTWTDWETTLNPTLEAEGIKERRCQVCQAFERETIERLKLKDTETDISVIFDEWAEGDPDIHLVVKQEEPEKIEIPGPYTYGEVDAHEIFLTDKDGNKVQPKGNVKVMIPLPAGFNRNAIAVFHRYSTPPYEVEQVRDFRFEEDDETVYVVFYTDSFSTFIIVDTGSKAEKLDPNRCPWCGKVHEGFFQKIIGFFHTIFAKLFGAKY